MMLDGHNVVSISIQETRDGEKSVFLWNLIYIQQVTGK